MTHPDPDLARHAARLGRRASGLAADPPAVCDHCAEPDRPLQGKAIHDAYGPWADDLMLCPACRDLVQQCQ
jgi:hypothetical protein